MLFLAFALIWFAITLWLWQRRSDFWRDLAAGGLLALLTCAFFWRTISGDVYQPADGGDLVSFLFPTYRFAAGQISQWTLPLWNPHLYGGAPFVSDIQAGFLYPPNLLLFLLNPQFDYRWLQWLAIGHLYWAGLGVYVLLRLLPSNLAATVAPRVGRGAALFAALAFQFSDALLIHLGNLNLIAVLSWLPWVLAAYHLALYRQSWRWAALAAVIFAVGNYAGHAQSSLYIGLAVLIYTVVWLGMEPRGWRTLLRLGIPLSVLLLVALLNAPILLPAYELTQQSVRSQFRYQDSVRFSLAPAQAVIGLITPGFFGRGPQLHWGLWDRVETPYIGVTALLLALAALWPRRRLGRLWPWFIMASFGFLVALGIYGLLHGVLTWLVPGFVQFRAPARAIVLWALGVSILSAYGLERLRTNAHDMLENWIGQYAAFLKWGALVLLGIVTPAIYATLLVTQSDATLFLRASLAALAVLLATGFWWTTWGIVSLARGGRLSSWGLAAALIALLFFDLAATGAYTDISESDPTLGYQHPEIAQFLRSDPEFFRIDTRTGIEQFWQPDAAALLGFQDVGGIANPLGLRSWQEFWESSGGRQTRLYDMLNVKYVIVQDGTPLPEGKFELAFDAPGELAVFRNKEALPRVWLVNQARFGQTPDLAYQTMPIGFDPTALVLIDAPALYEENAPGNAAAGSVTIEHNGSSEMILRVQATSAAYLVLSELWYPGWQANINGKRVEVYRANGALRALALPAGESQVRLWFAPASWRWGVIAWGVGVLLVLGIATARLPVWPVGAAGRRMSLLTIVISIALSACAPPAEIAADTPEPTITPTIIMPTAVVTPELPSEFSGAEQQMLLDAHNRWRSEVGAPPLLWSEELARVAQEWADTLAQNNKFEHRPGGIYGENIAGSYGSALEAVEIWVSEKAKYNGESIDGQNFLLFGHYTQVVWGKTRAVGCGTATNVDDMKITVCNYDPPGNRQGEKP